MSLSLLQDLWIYDDSECVDFARRLWWSQSSDSEAFEIIREGNNSRESFIEEISSELMSSTSKRLSVKGDSRRVDFYISNVRKNQWYFVAFIQMDDLNYNPNPSESAVLIYPSKSNIFDHLKAWIALCLFEPVVVAN